MTVEMPQQTVFLKVTAKYKLYKMILLDYEKNIQGGFWNQFETPALYCFKNVKQNKIEFTHKSLHGFS